MLVMATKRSVTTKKNIKLTPKDASTLLKLEFADYGAKTRDILEFTFEPMPINRGTIRLSKKREDK